MARFGLITLTLSLLLTTSTQSATAPSGWEKPKESVMKRITIKKRSQWIHTQWSNSAEFESQKAESLSKKRRAYITQIEKILGQYSTKAPKLPESYIELSLRLARYSLEEHYSVLVKTLKANPSALTDYSYLNKTEKIVGGLIQRFPQNPRADEFHYLFAVAELDYGRTNSALSKFQYVITQYPNSRFVYDATAQLADYAYEAGKFKQAEGHYDFIIRGKNSPLLTYATFKKAWCAFSTGRDEESVRLFKWIIDNEGALPTARLLPMRDEAIQDAIYPLVSLQNPHTAIAFYRPLEKSAFYKGLEETAMLFFERGFFNYAGQIWEHLVQADATYLNNATYDRMSIEALFRRNEKHDGLARLTQKMPYYFRDSQWAQANPASKPEVAKQLAGWEDLNRKYAGYFHNIGTKTGEKTALNHAKAAYALHLNYFPDSPENFQMTYQYASLLSSLKDYDDAAKYFVSAYKKAPDAQKAELALESAIGAQLAVMGKTINDSGKNTPKTDVARLGQRSKQTTTELNSDEKMFVALATEYGTKYPNAKKTPYVLLQRANLFYAHNNFDKAYPFLQDILKNHSNHPAAYSAAHAVLDISHQEHDWKNMIEQCENFKHSQLTEPGFQKEIQNIHRHASLKQVQALEDEKNYAEAAEGYMAYAANHGQKDRQLHETALYNASVNFDLANRFEDGLESRKEFLRLFPKSSYHPQVLLQVANRMRDVGQYGDAAKYYEQFVSLYPTAKQTPSAFEWTHSLYWAANQPAQSERLIKAYSKKHPGEKARLDGQLLALYEGEGWAKKAFDMHTNLSEDKNSAKAFIHLAKAAEWRYRNRAIPKAVLTKLEEFGKGHLGAIRKSPEAIDLYSKTLLSLLAPQEQEFKKLRLDVDAHKLEGRLKRKMEIMAGLEKQFSKIAGLGSTEWGLNAIYKTAYLYQRLAQEIAQAPLPKELSGEQMEEYRKTVAVKIQEPLVEKAKKFSHKCVKEASAHGLYSPWIAPCYQVASTLSPESVPALRTFFLPYMEVALLQDKDNQKAIPAEILPLLKVALPDSGTLASDERELADLLSGNDYSATAFTMDAEMKELRGKLAETRNLAEAKLSWEDLLSLTVSKSDRAVPAIQRALRASPDSIALGNLLAIAHLQRGNLPAARIALQTIALKKADAGAVENNLAIIQLLKGEKRLAIAGLERAHQKGSSEASLNLGTLALKFHNGELAKNHFSSALGEANLGERAKDGLFVSYLQAGNFPKARELAEDTATLSPYRRLSTAYWLMDVEEDGNTKAEELLSSYLKDRKENEDDHHFKKAVQELRRQPSKPTVADATPIQASVTE